jgi:hypothetical protein
VHTFVCDKDTHAGYIPEKVGAAPPDHAWGSIWRAYRPEWSDRPLSELTAEELNAHTGHKKAGSEFSKFVRWMREGNH